MKKITFVLFVLVLGLEANAKAWTWGRVERFISNSEEYSDEVMYLKYDDGFFGSEKLYAPNGRRVWSRTKYTQSGMYLVTVYHGAGDRVLYMVKDYLGSSSDEDRFMSTVPLAEDSCLVTSSNEARQGYHHQCNCKGSDKKQDAPVTIIVLTVFGLSILLVVYQLNKD